MKAGIANISFIPMRREPSHKSEMVSQLMFGELYTIIEDSKDWKYVKTDFDGYEGWIDASQVVVITEGEYEDLKKQEVKHSQGLFSLITEKSKGVQFAIPFGSKIYASHFKFGDEEFTYEGNYIEQVGNMRSQIVEIALKFLNVPYLWGGRTPFGIDCSGFTQIIFKSLGVKLLRDAREQADSGKDVGFVNEAQQGDLAFFGDEENITHVGIVMGGEKIVHASGKVRVDKLDHHGIYNLDSKKYTHKLRIIKNVVD